jgi:low affinity Fe/Cu permease
MHLNSFLSNLLPRQVKIDAELIINICENSSVTIQPVTPTEISKLVATLKKKKAEDIDNLTAGHLKAVWFKR